jgi:hypothetical protein
LIKIKPPAFSAFRPGHRELVIDTVEKELLIETPLGLLYFANSETNH